MSILSSLYHGEIHDKPNDVHNVPAEEKRGAEQTAPDANWMTVPLADTSAGDTGAADWSALDAQIADAHAMAASCALDHSGADSPAKKCDPQNGGGTEGSAVLPAHAERRIHALREGNLRPPLYYTQQEQKPCENGVWESAHTVASKLESKEEFPQG